MGRLTKRIEVEFPKGIQKGIELDSMLNVYEDEDFYDIANKLAHYEDLEEQLMESAEIDIDSMVGEFMHYYNLQKENRLIELPCAVGDTVYVVTACENVVMNHDNDYFTGTGAIECPYEDDCPYADCGDENKRVFETYCSKIYLDEDGFNIILEDFAFTVTLEDFGKTVFLTKEEAEAKLRDLLEIENVKVFKEKFKELKELEGVKE